MPPELPPDAKVSGGTEQHQLPDNSRYLPEFRNLERDGIFRVATRRQRDPLGRTTVGAPRTILVGYGHDDEVREA